MARPATRSLRFGLGVALSGLAGLAREPAPMPPKPATESAPPRERVVSAHVAGLLAASRPRFEVSKPAESKGGEPTAAFPDKPANEIVRLPNFVVREPRLPTPEDVRTPRGLEIYAMNKYLGRPNGFSRAVLNRFTLAEAWKNTVKHVPILNRFEWFSSPEKTAVAMYYDDEVRNKMRDLYGLLEIPAKLPTRSNGEIRPPATAPNSDGK